MYTTRRIQILRNLKSLLKLNQGVTMVKSEDRLSSLPDELLLNILSFIPTKQVITSTSLISKRWRYFWRSLPSLLFHYDGVYKRSPWFTDFIATTLMFHNIKTLEKFSVNFDFWYRRVNGHTTVNTWLRFATMKSVRELRIHLGSASNYKYYLPLTIFDNNVVEVLSFKGCHIKPYPKTVSWGSLKYLTVMGCDSINGDTIRVILKGSPKILRLDFIDCYDTDRGHAMDYHYEFN